MIYKYTWPDRIENVGIENIRGQSDYVGATDEAHSWSFIAVGNAQHVWVQNIAARHFVYAAVQTLPTSKWVTVENAYYLDPVSKVDGGRRYAFTFDGQLGLVKDVWSQKGRHDFVVGPSVPGPNVFLDSVAYSSSNDSGPHHRWSTGVLLDNVKVPGNYISIRNRGNSGTGHGWSGANSVVWNAQARGFIVENPPTAQNWLIGSIGPDVKNNMAVGSHPKGIKDSPGTNVQPRSLYYAQLQERLKRPGLEHREYWLGDIDGVKRDSAVDDAFMDMDWLTEVRTQATKVQSFDQINKASWVPFSYRFQLAPNEEVVSATLSLGVKASQSNISDNRLYIDSLGTSVAVSQLGWGAITTSAVSGVTVDLTSYLTQLQDGQLNLALSDDLLVDWSVLNIQVAPRIDEPDVVLYADADVTVRGGANAALNFGSETTLGVQGGNMSETLLTFNLSGLIGPVEHAVVQLPILSAAAGAENGAAQVRTAWVEDAVTWNTKPTSTNPFVSWVAKPGKTVEFAVTTQVQRLLDEGGTTLSLRILSTNGGGLVTYGSSEGDLAYGPQLLVYSSQPQNSTTTSPPLGDPPQPPLETTDPIDEPEAEETPPPVQEQTPPPADPPPAPPPVSVSSGVSSSGGSSSSRMSESRFRALFKSLSKKN